MLNELALLKNGIEEINPEILIRQHKSISEPGKQNLIRVVLDEREIIELELLDNDKNKKYWTRRDGKKNSFPAVKIPFPIRPGGVEAFRKWKERNRNPLSEQLAKCLKEFREKYPIDIEQHKCWPNYREQIIKQKEIYANLQGDESIVHKLTDTYLSFEENGLSLLKRFDEFLGCKCREPNINRNLLDFAFLAMFANGEKLKDNMTPDGKRITLLLDVQGNDTHSAANRHWTPKLSELLFREEKNKQKTVETGVCAISGSEEKLVPDTFPEPRCEVLGDVKIFSRKRGVHTYKRYGKEAAGSYSLSKSLADYLSSTLRYLCGGKETEGKTWDKLPKEMKKDKNDTQPDLLVAFCRAASDRNIVKLVSYEGEMDAHFDEIDYEMEAEKICKSFKGEDILLHEKVDFLILRKISKGVQKAIFSSSTPVSHLENSSHDWSESCKNTPPIKLGILKNGEKKPVYFSPKPISPKQFAFLFRKNYKRSLQQNVDVPGVAFANIMRVFLGDARTSELACNLLQRLLNNFSNLLEKIALERSKRSKDFSMRKYHPDALRVIAAIGLLLAKLNRKKEVYMKDIAYILGQFCAALDEVHIGYCEDKRKGQIPSRLIGNQAYATAVVNPQKSLGLTAQRSAVYFAWAKKISRKSDDNLSHSLKNAKYAYFWLQKNCPKMHQLFSSETVQPTPEYKAELLLGYLAGRPIERRQNRDSEPHNL